MNCILVHAIIMLLGHSLYRPLPLWLCHYLHLYSRTVGTIFSESSDLFRFYALTNKPFLVSFAYTVTISRMYRGKLGPLMGWPSAGVSWPDAPVQWRGV